MAQDASVRIASPNVLAACRTRVPTFVGAMLPMRSMKAKAMKSMKKASGLTATAAYQVVADKSGLKRKDVKAVMETYLDVCAGELKKVGTVKIGQALKLKLKVKPATPARKGVNPFTKGPCVFKAKPASKTVRALPMKKLKEMVN